MRVHAAGVIHTELGWVPTWSTRAGKSRPLPVIPGHEFSGEIRRDRYAMLSPVLLERLRAWWRVARAQGRMPDGGWLL